jgi:hypothetical protein
MSFDLEKILASKRAFRRELARRPIAETTHARRIARTHDGPARIKEEGLRTWTK